MNEPEIPHVAGLSVVVPVLNGEQELPACLEALTQQTWPKDRTEIIVVDDGSSDGTRREADAFANRGVRCIALPATEGRIEARKRGAEAASFDRLVFIDCRVIADLDLLESFAKFTQHPVIGRIRHLDGPTLLDRFFYRFKARYYHPYLEEAFAPHLFIEPSSLRQRVPVGMGIFSCNRNDFFRAMPEDRGRYAHDDTALFERMLSFTPIEKRCEPAATYVQRQSWGATTRHLFDRGRRFGNYHLIRNPWIRIAYALLLILISSFVLLAYAVPDAAAMILLVAVIGLVVTVRVLDRDLARNEVFRFAACAVGVGLPFLAGICRSRWWECLIWGAIPWFLAGIPTFS